ncbi:rod shape-determining protein MreD [Bacillus alkalicellulosilyticus]|uniref:rod shape-determining protein MreD n=1 Tax=Alkalihalobacterium alkalicellulosilyticum TaxID=1912214 RepID=UPI000998164E|nr:rod shape-determining protein MreD [Bacillus alkalicellulosilyticus]
MSRFLLPAIVFIFFILEGTVFQIFAPERYGATFVIIPRMVLITIVIIGIIRGRTSGVLFGIGFGLLYDVVYTEMLGVYMFSMGVIGYVCSLPYRPIQRSYFLIVLTCIIAVIIQEYYLFGVYSLLGIAHMTSEQFLYSRFSSTLLFNIFLSLILVGPLRKYVQYLDRMEKQLDQ